MRFKKDEGTPHGDEERGRIAEFLKTYTAQHGYAPTLREICAGCSISSTSLVSYHLKVMERNGVVRRKKHSARAVALTNR